MDKSSLLNQGLHVAIIMDGNGRWATARGRSRTAGHRAGARAVRPVVEAAPRLGITTLTLYAFSSDNWQRPGYEVTSLMRLLRIYLRAEIDTCLKNRVRLSVIGRRDRLSPGLQEAIAVAEEATRHGDVLHLRLAIDYSARDVIARAARLVDPALEPSPRAVAQAIGAVTGGETAPDVDLLIRTGGEQRLSDFLLWECAYAELLFLPIMWPEFTPAHLEDAVREFQRRERRFGRVPVSLSS